MDRGEEWDVYERCQFAGCGEPLPLGHDPRMKFCPPPRTCRQKNHRAKAREARERRGFWGRRA
jgi:hypothetical protein